MGSKLSRFLGAALQEVGTGVQRYGAEVRAGKMKDIERKQRESDIERAEEHQVKLVGMRTTASKEAAEELREFTTTEGKKTREHQVEIRGLDRAATEKTNRERLRSQAYLAIQRSVNAQVSSGAIEAEAGAKMIEDNYGAYLQRMEQMNSDELKIELDDVEKDLEKDDGIDKPKIEEATPSQNAYDRAVSKVETMAKGFVGTGSELPDRARRLKIERIAKDALSKFDVDITDAGVEGFVDKINREYESAKTRLAEEKTTKEKTTVSEREKRSQFFLDNVETKADDIIIITTKEERDALEVGTQYRRVAGGRIFTKK